MQLIINSKICVYTLASTEIETRHTGVNLKRMILDALKRYGIEHKHIYSVTSDSGSNLLKAIRLIDESDDFNFEEDEENKSSDQLAIDVGQINWDEDEQNALGIIGNFFFFFNIL